MPDIFISYSRKDSEQALALAERLRSAGMDIWIDQHGIGGAEKWATEIVEGIRACSTFIVLLSHNSIQSENVLRELSLASEKRKRVLPVDIESTILPSSFEYPLAGLQRVAISDFEAILLAHEHGVSRVAVKDARKSLIVLPFEDLSPGQDNGWFADGLASELIDSLGHIKSLRLIDRKTAMELKGFRGKTMEIADALQVRYFIEGSVRKFGEQIKISVSLLDIESGDYLWQESHRGEFKDIFDIQEAVANKVVVGLKLHLTKDEKAKVLERGTENAEAYELCIKATEYYERQTHESMRHAVQLLSEAIRLDPGYASAHYSKGYVLASIYRSYDRDSELLHKAEKLVQEALRLKPDLWNAYHALSTIYRLQGNLEKAESAVEQYIEKAPDESHSHFALGFFYHNTDRSAKAIEPYETAVKLRPGDLVSLWNLVVACQSANDPVKLKYWAACSIPYLERHLKLHPDDENQRVNYANTLHLAGRNTEAREAAKALDGIRDGKSLYNTACLWASLGDLELSLKTILKSIESGYKNIPALNGFLEDEFAPFKGTKEYEDVRKIVSSLGVTSEQR